MAKHLPSKSETTMELKVTVMSESLHMLATSNKETRGALAWQMLKYLEEPTQFWLERRMWTMKQWLDMAINDYYEAIENTELTRHTEPVDGFTLCGGSSRYGRQILA